MSQSCHFLRLTGQASSNVPCETGETTLPLRLPSLLTRTMRKKEGVMLETPVSKNSDQGQDQYGELGASQVTGRGEGVRGEDWVGQPV